MTRKKKSVWFSMCELVWLIPLKQRAVSVQATLKDFSECLDYDLTLFRQSNSHSASTSHLAHLGFSLLHFPRSSTVYPPHGKKTISSTFPGPGARTDTWMRPPRQNRQWSGVGAVSESPSKERMQVFFFFLDKKEKEKVGNSHTWKRFPEPRGFKRRTMESDNTLKQLRAAQSGSH